MGNYKAEYKKTVFKTLNHKKAKTSQCKEELKKEINSMQCLIKTSNMKEKDKTDTLKAPDTKKLELEKIIEYGMKG